MNRPEKVFCTSTTECVLTLEGWQDSVGVTAEIAIARDSGKPVGYLTPDCGENPPTLARVAEDGEV